MLSRMKRFQIRLLSCSFFVLSCMPLSFLASGTSIYHVSSTKQLFQLSPSGNEIAYLDTCAPARGIYLDDFRNNKKILWARVPEHTLFFFWKNNNILLYAETSSDKTIYHALLRSNAKPIPFNVKEDYTLLDEWPQSDSCVLLHLTKHPLWGNCVTSYNIYSQSQTLKYKNDPAFTSFLLNPDGRLTWACKKNNHTWEYYYRNDEQEPFQICLSVPDTVFFKPVAYTYTHESLWAISNFNSDKNRVIEFFPEAGNYNVLFSDSLADLNEFSYSLSNRMLTANKRYHLKKENSFLDENRKNIWEKVSAKAMSDDLFFMGTDDEENSFLLKTFPSNHPGKYYLYDGKNAMVHEYYNLNQWLNEKNTRKTITCLKTIHEQPYLFYYTPAHSNNSDTLYIYSHHKGARLKYQYNPTLQEMSAKGISVLMINMPGTDGFGKSYQNTILSAQEINDAIETGLKHFNLNHTVYIHVDEKLIPLTK